MKKKEKQVLIWTGVGILIFLIILGLIFFAVSVSKQKQARIGGYNQCKNDLDGEWQQARSLMEQARGKESEFNNTLNSLINCNENLSSCNSNLTECQKIISSPNNYYLFNKVFEYSYEEITTIILGIFLIIPLSFGFSLIKFVVKIEINWFAFFLGVLFAFLVIFIIIIVGMGVG